MSLPDTLLKDFIAEKTEPYVVKQKIMHEMALQHFWNRTWEDKPWEGTGKNPTIVEFHHVAFRFYKESETERRNEQKCRAFVDSQFSNWKLGHIRQENNLQLMFREDCWREIKHGNIGSSPVYNRNPTNGQTGFNDAPPTGGKLRRF